MKTGQLRSLERLYKRRFPKDALYSLEQARELALLSRSLNRQIALLINRAGKPQMVIAGSASSIYIPELPPVASARLRGLRLLHTHLDPSGLNDEDLLDMLFLRLDGIACLTVNDLGEPQQWQGAWLMPTKVPDSLLDVRGAGGNHSCYLGDMQSWADARCNHTSISMDIERSLDLQRPQACAEPRAILISVSEDHRSVQDKHLEELALLCKSAGIKPGGFLVQRKKPGSGHLLIGKGKLAELEVMALGANAEILIFDGELTPAQLHDISDLTERKVMDRTQLILDIFAQNATTGTGKLQVELAQLTYLLPRLAGGRKALDRLAGGIGGRGPGESRLETDRRKLKSRMEFLGKELKKLKKQRSVTRMKRERAGIPVAALVGYTNTGKSTLLNALTKSDTYAANRLFATLDPVTRRLRFPEEREITLADTVGFIRNLPAELKDAFAATLEELHRADLLIQVADASHPDVEKQIAAVESILDELELDNKPRLLVLNKCDRIAVPNRQFPGAIFVSAQTGQGLDKLLLKIEQNLFINGKTKTCACYGEQ